MRSKNNLAQDITIFDVAEKAGVSHSTVSRVLNNKTNISAQTRERVLHAMEQLGYVGNIHARSLAGGASRVIGLLVDHVNTGYTDELIKGIDWALEAHDYNLMLYTTHRQKTREAAYVTKMTQGLADGLILIVPRNERAYLETFATHRLYPQRFGLYHSLIFENNHRLPAEKVSDDCSPPLATDWRGKGW